MRFGPRPAVDYRLGTCLCFSDGESGWLMMASCRNPTTPKLGKFQLDFLGRVSWTSSLHPKMDINEIVWPPSVDKDVWFFNVFSTSLSLIIAQCASCNTETVE